jgi:hypothetical protein
MGVQSLPLTMPQAEITTRFGAARDAASARVRLGA